MTNSPLRCLIVEDNDKWLKLVTSIMDKLDFQAVESCRSSEDTLGVINRFDPYVVVFDISGSDSISQMRLIQDSVHRDMKIIAFSEIVKKETVLETIYAGASHYIVKSEDVRMIYQSFATFMAKHKISTLNYTFKPHQVLSFCNQ